VKREYKKGVNSLIILGAWMIWKHINDCVFEGMAPSVASIMREIKAGAKKLQGLGLAGAL
jgi:hypothetical protein